MIEIGKLIALGPKPLREINAVSSLYNKRTSEKTRDWNRDIKSHAYIIELLQDFTKAFSVSVFVARNVVPTVESAVF